VSYYDDLLATTPASTTAPDAFAGLLDAGTSMLTGTLGQGAGLASQLIGRLTGGDPKQEYQNAQSLQDALTYRPRTKWGKDALDLLGRGFESVANSAPIAAIADPIEQKIVKAGVNPYDLTGLTAGAGLLVGPEDSFEARASYPGRLPTYAADHAAPRLSAPYPEYAAAYPPVPPSVMKIDKTSGKEYEAKGESPETKSFMKARTLVQRDIEGGNYQPYFDVDKRYDVDPSNYPAGGNTLTDTLPKKQATIDKHTSAIQTDEARARLNAAYDAGIASGGHDRWYQMGQLEHEFVDELGPEEGRKQFKARFADAMAATTGGADPTSNLLMAGYGNHLAASGAAIPDASYKMPVPIGGRFVTGNMEQYGNLLQRGEIPVANEKRHNFSRNFLGDADHSTIDEQMTGIISPGKQAPPNNTYGIYEDLLSQEAAKRGVDPRDFQDVAWGGKKSMDTGGKYAGKPMIQHVNEAIERTSRLTGLSPRDVVRRGLVRGQIPLYGLAGLSAGAGLLYNGGGLDDDAAY
jgi:hypothetical protein